MQQFHELEISSRNWILNMNICNLIDDGGHHTKVESITISMKKTSYFDV